jgi:hypothetical protein
MKCKQQQYISVAIALKSCYCNSVKSNWKEKKRLLPLVWIANSIFSDINAITSQKYRIKIFFPKTIFAVLQSFPPYSFIELMPLNIDVGLSLPAVILFVRRLQT